MMGADFVCHAPGRAAEAQGGRYEYRVWPGPEHPALSRLHRGWPLVAAERRSDIYLPGPNPDRRLAKLRNGRRLQIKARGRDLGALQHWSMPVSADFPLSATARGALAEALGLRVRLEAESGRSPAHLLSALGAAGDGVMSFRLRKSRLLFERGGCRAEICRVATGGRTGLTVALEGAAPDLVAQAIDDLGLGGHPNLSYGDMPRHLARPRRVPLRRLIPVHIEERRDP